MAEAKESTVGAKLKETASHSVVYGLGSIAQSAVQFLLIPVLTGALSSSAFGAFSLIQMVSTVASSVLYLGVTSALPRSYYDYSDPLDRKSVFTTAFLVLLAGAGLQATLGLLGGRFLSILVIRTPEYGGAMAWALVGAAFMFINYFLFTWLRFERKSFTSVAYSTLTLTGSIGLSFVLLKLRPGDVSSPFVAICVTQVGILAVFIAVFGRRAFTFRILPREIPLLLSYGLPTVLSSFAGMLLDWSDRIFIERSVSLGAAGLYSAAFRLGSLVNVLLVSPFAMIWQPMMMEYRHHSNIDEFFTRIISYFFLAGALILIMASLFLRNAMPLVIRSGYAATLTPITLMVLAGYLVYGFSNICSAGLIYERKTMVFVYVYYSVALAKIAVNAFVIPAYGIHGAAATTLAADLLVPTGLYLVSRRYFSIHIDRARLTRLVAVVSVPFLYALVIEPRVALPWPLKVPFALAGLAAILRFCTNREEKEWLRRLLPNFSRG